MLIAVLLAFLKLVFPFSVLSQSIGHLHLFFIILLLNCSQLRPANIQDGIFNFPKGCDLFYSEVLVFA